jgi:hypothetical protein
MTPLAVKTLCDAALAYVRRGFRVLPLTPCAKEPLFRLAPNAYKSASNDEATVIRWWTEEPDANVGIACVDGLIVIDLDRHEGKPDGVEAWERIASEHPQIETLTQITGGNGRHVLFRSPQGVFTTGSSRGTVLDGVGGIDIVVNGYIVAHPSVVDGNMYRWANDASIATLPSWYYSPQRTLSTGTSTYLPRFILEPTEIEAQALLLMEDVDPTALLGESTLRLIVDGDPKETDQSTIISRICRGAAQCRFDPAQLFEMLESQRNVGGKGLRRRIKENGEAFGRRWLDGNMLYAHGCRAELLADIECMRVEAQEYDWPRSIKFTGRNGEYKSVKGSTAKQVLLAGLEVATERVCLDPMLGIDKHLPTLTGLNKKTCRRAVEALEHLGWWSASKFNKPGSMTNAYIYTLDPSPEARLHPPLKVATFRTRDHPCGVGCDRTSTVA